jgi:type IV pilus assembly protein PilQ
MEGKVILPLFLLLLVLNAAGQQDDTIRSVHLKETLDAVVAADPAFGAKIDLSVSGTSLSGLIKNIAQASGANLSISASGERTVTCNFRQVRVSDIIHFLCLEYSLDVELIENILLVKPYLPPVPDAELELSYNGRDGTVSFGFSGAALADVAKKIGKETGVNVVMPRELFDYPVYAFGRDMKTDEAIQVMAAANSLSDKKTGGNTWMIYKRDTVTTEAKSLAFDHNELSVDSLGRITANITGGNIHDILTEVSEKLGINHFFTGRLDGQATFVTDRVNVDDFLRVLFTGTPFSWRTENGIYIFGGEEAAGNLAELMVIPMKYRTIDKVKDIIPEALKQNMEIITFPDLNCLIVYGRQSDVQKTAMFLKQIDKSVMLISIDVIIVDATDTDAMEAGVSFGKGTEPTTSTGTLSPGVDITLGASSINRLINTFNGFGSINLGKVGPNFYMGLKLLEEKGQIVVKSTPRLSTLNGHKAELKSGEKKYYKEIQSSIIGTQNPIQSESFIWKDTEANFTLDILPYVSLDSCITLEIEIVQSEFTERESDSVEVPPGTVTRSFKSIIKVKDQEMVLLGGIEKNTISKSSKGLPFIARMPVLKWIFGQSSKSDYTQKLSVFVKPAII